MTPPRLHVAEALGPGVRIPLEAARISYLRTVLRRRPGDPVRVFNAGDGEWQARLAISSKREAALDVEHRLLPPRLEAGPTLALAPIRRSRLEWVVEKAVELGVATIELVLTERAVAKIDNPGRLRAIAIEAAEQAGRLSVPPVVPPVTLGAWIEARRGRGPFLVADATGADQPILRAVRAQGVLIGPEGGFSPDEQASLRAVPELVPVRLGPRTLRAETAALAALAALVLSADAAVSSGP